MIELQKKKTRNRIFQVGNDLKGAVFFLSKFGEKEKRKMIHSVRISQELYEKMKREKPKGMTQSMYFDLLLEQQKKLQKILKKQDEILQILTEKDEKTFQSTSSNFLRDLNEN